MLGEGRLQRAGDLPAGAFRARIEGLSAQARGRALNLLNRNAFPPEDVASLNATDAGDIYYSCVFPGIHPIAEPAPPAGPSMLASIPVTPFPAALRFHSKPGSANILFLDFNGTTVTDTSWNIAFGQSIFTPVAFSADSDYATFNDAEQATIKRVWQRVAEDYAEFDIDVTTEEPATFNDRTAHAVITRSTDSTGRANPQSTSGGVAYLDVFAGESLS